MAALVVDGGDLVVRLSPLEKICTFRGNVRVPLTAVRAAAVDPQPWRSLLSLRRVRISPGVATTPPALDLLRRRQLVRLAQQAAGATLLGSSSLVIRHTCTMVDLRLRVSIEMA